MSSTVFYNVQLFHILFVNLFLIWQSFFSLNQLISYTKELNIKQTIVSDSRLDQKTSDLSILRVSFILYLVSFIHISTMKFSSGYIFFDQCYISESSRRYFLLISFIYIFITYLNLLLHSNKINLPSDYSCSNITLFIISPYIFLCSNFYSFFFVIELLGIIILVKFTFLPLTYSNKGESKTTITSTPKPLVLSIFTYYWMSFFSSSFILVYILFMLFTWGTVDYFELLTLSTFDNVLLKSISSIYYPILGLLFSFGFLLKAGAAPFHLYKASLYKGLPLFSILNYTLVFYLTYLIYFSLIIPVIVQSSGILSVYFLAAVTLVSLLLLSTSLFSNRHLKTFLALSSALNAAVLVMILISVTI